RLLRWPGRRCRGKRLRPAPAARPGERARLRREGRRHARRSHSRGSCRRGAAAHRVDGEEGEGPGGERCEGNTSASRMLSWVKWCKLEMGKLAVLTASRSTQLNCSGAAYR